MLYKGYSIQIWKSEWIDKWIGGEYHHLGCEYLDARMPGQNNKYIALLDRLNPRRSYKILGGSTPKIAMDLAKFTIDLDESNSQRFDIMERYRIYNQKCLKKRLEKLSGNT